MEESIEYRLGGISARLDDNDRSHTEMKSYLFNIQNSIDRIEGSINDNKVELAGIKGKASVWGTIAGFLVATVVSIVGWFVLRR